MITSNNDSLNTQPEKDPAILSDFALDSQTAIQKLIEHINEEESELYVYIHPAESSFVSEIIDLECNPNGHGKIWVATPFDKSLLDGLTPETLFTMVSFPAGVKVQLCGHGMTLDKHGKLEVLSLPIPEQAIRVQRRNYFRVIADEEMMTHVRIKDSRLRGDFELIDLSVGGCAISVEGQPENFECGATIDQAELVLPDQVSPIEVHLTVKNVMVNPENQQHVCLGCEMRLHDKKEADRLQRFLLNTERRQQVRQAAY